MRRIDAMKMAIMRSIERIAEPSASAAMTWIFLSVRSMFAMLDTVLHQL